MPIKRAEHTKDFTMILNAVLNDERLSYGARGLMAHVLTHYDNWAFTGEEYFVTEKDKKSKVKGYLKELIKYGYLKRYQEKNLKGTFGNSVYNFYELPMLEKPMSEKPMSENQTTDKGTNNSKVSPKTVLPITEKPMSEKPTSENRTLNNTNINNTNNNIYSDFTKKIIKLYPGKKVKSVRDKKLPKILKQYSEEEIYRCVERYSRECKGKEAQYILNESTFWNGRYIDYLDSNYEESRQDKPKREITNFDDE